MYERGFAEIFDTFRRNDNFKQFKRILFPSNQEFFRAPAFKIIFAHKITVLFYFIIVDATNQLMYPSPKLIKVQHGWYILHGYDAHAHELVFSDAGFRNLYNGLRMRIWYGEDLYDYSEADNHGRTCMNIYVYVADV